MNIYFCVYFVQAINVLINYGDFLGKSRDSLGIYKNDVKNDENENKNDEKW